MPCYIINGVNIKLCSHCRCLAPRFVPVSKTGVNQDESGGGGGGQGVRTTPGIARLLVFAMLKFSVRPLLGIWTPPPPP